MMVIRKGGALLLAAILLIAGIFGAAKAMRYFYQKAYPLGYEQLVLSACEENELEPSFVFAVIRTESCFRCGCTIQCWRTGIDADYGGNFPMDSVSHER